MNFSFQLTHTDGKARHGTCTTPHGVYETPQFMSVGTKGSVRGVDVERLKEAGAEVVLVNTYHLWIRPTSKLISELGGVHHFISWPGPILSDSGGFQVYSLAKLRKITEDGVEFRSHLDGALCFLSPEKAIEIQDELGVDIAMVLDECPASSMPRDQVEQSLGLTMRWAKRCISVRKRDNMAIFGITQGGVHKDLRGRAAEGISDLPFNGCAIGGLSVGEPKPVMREVLSYHVDQLPRHKVRYLMGMGTPEDILYGVNEGVDMFDCVLPTRSGRFGRAYVRGERPFLNLVNAEFTTDSSPLDPSCHCVACRNYSRAYLSHLFRMHEMLGPELVSVHNLTHYYDLIKGMREAIKEKRFKIFFEKEAKRWKGAEEVTE